MSCPSRICIRVFATLCIHVSVPNRIWYSYPSPCNLDIQIYLHVQMSSYHYQLSIQLLTYTIYYSLSRQHNQNMIKVLRSNIIVPVLSSGSGELVEMKWTMKQSTRLEGRGRVLCGICASLGQVDVWRIWSEKMGYVSSIFELMWSSRSGHMQRKCPVTTGHPS